jgi:hypothetical protein
MLWPLYFWGKKPWHHILVLFIYSLLFTDVKMAKVCGCIGFGRKELWPNLTIEKRGADCFI